MAEKSALNAGIGGHTPLPHLTPTRPCPLGEPTDLPRPPDKKSHFQAGKPLLENEFEVDTCTAVMLLYEHWEWYVTIVYTKI